MKSLPFIGLQRINLLASNFIPYQDRWTHPSLKDEMVPHLQRLQADLQCFYAPAEVHEFAQAISLMLEVGPPFIDLQRDHEAALNWMKEHMQDYHSNFHTFGTPPWQGDTLWCRAWSESFINTLYGSGTWNWPYVSVQLSSCAQRWGKVRNADMERMGWSILPPFSVAVQYLRFSVQKDLQQVYQDWHKPQNSSLV